MSFMLFTYTQFLHTIADYLVVSVTDGSPKKRPKKQEVAVALKTPAVLPPAPSAPLVSPDSDGHSSDGDRKRKKARTTFTGRQIFELERQFELKKYLSSSERADMAKLLGVTETQVRRVVDLAVVSGGLFIHGFIVYYLILTT